MNILVTSAGRRVKIIQYFKQALQDKGKIIAADCDHKASALYFADDFELIPRIDDKDYILEIINICKKNKITAIVSLLDPELEVLIKNKDTFDKHQIKLILSTPDMIEMTFDKRKTHDKLIELNMPVVPTYNNKQEFLKANKNQEHSFPAIIKPIKGSASLGLLTVNDEKELNNKFQENAGLIIQPFYRDKEFGIDAYIDLISGELIDLFIKEKLLMRSGETDKAISVHNEKIKKLVIDLISKTNFSGPIDIDCFEFEGNYYISEINPRFGGGYPHAYELGCNYMDYIINNLEGTSNVGFKSYNYESGLIMMKYDEIKIIKE